MKDFENQDDYEKKSKDFEEGNDNVNYADNAYEQNTNYINNDNSSKIPKKNRTLQYYKFLFYSLKTEIKVHDFLKLIRTSNVSEMVIWVLSVILYANTPKDLGTSPDGKKTSSYKNAFIWFHIVHVARALLGIFLVWKLPRSYQIIDSIGKIKDEKLERCLFNDLIRENMYKNVTEVIKGKKLFIYVYFGLTVFNFIFDLVDFLVILSSLSSAISNSKVVLLTYMILASLYITIDLSYIFWTGQLKYIFPPEYLRPIDSVFMGTIDKAMIKFKLRKPKTDIVDEAKAQQGSGPFVKSSNEMKNGGVNILENIFKDSFGVYHPEEGNLPELKDKIRSQS